ncbi:hypothetical protein CLCR_11037 [Cladophialophora carrionii]|uniref:Uncharacterized protein n=1 Tax=Cladophialophora carrionii TaxID=86049 RepID=A0A1C1CW07_9EURO|nr:hypothetical protein CLCR_11037 [Cladophialophora carrionii]
MSSIPGPAMAGPCRSRNVQRHMLFKVTLCRKAAAVHRAGSIGKSKAAQDLDHLKQQGSERASELDLDHLDLEAARCQAQPTGVTCCLEACSQPGGLNSARIAPSKLEIRVSL